MTLYYGKDSNGNYGFYDDTISTQIPEGAVEITVEQHQALLAGQSAGQIIQPDSNGNPSLANQPAPLLAAYQATMLAKIDKDAAALRGLFITANSGQVATYIMKYNDASAFKTAGYTGTVPGLVQAEADATGEDAKTAADDIIAQYTAWNTLAAAIEKVRRIAKIAVAAAKANSDVDAAITAVEAGFAQIKAQAASST